MCGKSLLNSLAPWLNEKYFENDTVKSIKNILQYKFSVVVSEGLTDKKELYLSCTKQSLFYIESNTYLSKLACFQQAFL